MPSINHFLKLPGTSFRKQVSCISSQYQVSPVWKSLAQSWERESSLCKKRDGVRSVLQITRSLSAFPLLWSHPLWTAWTSFSNWIKCSKNELPPPTRTYTRVHIRRTDGRTDDKRSSAQPWTACRTVHRNHTTQRTKTEVSKLSLFFIQNFGHVDTSGASSEMTANTSDLSHPLFHPGSLRNADIQKNGPLRFRPKPVCFLHLSSDAVKEYGWTALKNTLWGATPKWLPHSLIQSASTDCISATCRMLCWVLKPSHRSADPKSST